jgi:hypothetical protein
LVTGFESGRRSSIAFASAARPARLSDIHNQSVEPASSPASGAIGCALANDAARPGKVSAQVLDDAEVVPDAVDGAVDGAAARQIGERAIEFTHRQISMPAPSEKQRVVRFDLEPARERRDGFAKLPRTGPGDAEVDDLRDVVRVGVVRGARFLDGVGIGKRSILHALG